MMKSRRLFRGAPWLLFLLVFLGGGFLVRPALADTSIKGEITEVMPDPNRVTGKITVDTGKETLTFNVGTFTWLTKDNFDCKIKHLRVGDRVRASVFEENGKIAALRVEAQTYGRRKIIKGALREISPNTPLVKVDERGRSTDKITSVYFDDSTLFVYGGSAVEASALKVGDNVSIIASGGSSNEIPVATRVDINSNFSQNPVLVTGILKSVVDEETVIIKTWKNGEEEVLALDTVRHMSRNKQPLKAFDLNRGEQIMVIGLRNFAGGVDVLMLVATTTHRFSGTISSIDLANNTIEFLPFVKDSQPIKLLLLSASVLLLNGKETTLNELKELELDDDDIVNVSSIVHTEGPWGITNLEVLRLKDDDNVDDRDERP